MRNGYVGKAYQIIVDTPNKQSGLTDVQFTIFNAGGVVVTGSPFSATEIASSGVYTASWTPTVAGDYVIEVSSAALGISEVSSAVHIEPIDNQDLSTQIAGLENLSANDVWTSASRTLTDKTGFELTAGAYQAIASAVETAILNEGDGQAVIDAIVNAIGNTNLDQVALVAAIRTDLERSGGLLDVIQNTINNNNITFRIIN